MENSNWGRAGRGKLQRGHGKLQTATENFTAPAEPHQGPGEGPGEGPIPAGPPEGPGEDPGKGPGEGPIPAGPPEGPGKGPGPRGGPTGGLHQGPRPDARARL